MIVLSPNQEQYNKLNGYTSGIYRLEFAVDGSGKYIALLNILTFEPFKEIWDELNQLERIEYTPYPDLEE
jgi:hypothetical protein